MRPRHYLWAATGVLGFSVVCLIINLIAGSELDAVIVLLLIGYGLVGEYNYSHLKEIIERREAYQQIHPKVNK